MEKVFGLIGAAVSHSFSKSYFDEKFFREGLRDYHYELFPLSNIKEIEKLLKDTKGLSGLNVTIPYKEQVLKYLDEVDGFAKKIGAVNVIKIKDGKLKGFNNTIRGGIDFFFSEKSIRSIYVSRFRNGNTLFLYCRIFKTYESK